MRPLEIFRRALGLCLNCRSVHMNIRCMAVKLAITFIRVSLVLGNVLVEDAGHERIVGGTEIRRHEFPSFVTGLPGGSGTLLYPQWVLTAAHLGKQANYKYDFVRAGQHSIKGEEWLQAEKRNISKWYIHEHYENPSHHSNDIALAKLESPYNLSDIIQTVTLPTKDYVEYGKCAWPVGYGFQCENCSGVAVPYKVDVPIRTPEKCWEYLEWPYENDSMLCAGYDEGGKGTCKRDSGGPLYVIEDGKHIQVGIVSWGRGCARPELPGGFVRVSYYLDWIAETIRKDGEDPNFQYPPPKGGWKTISTGVVQSVCQQYSAYKEKGQLQNPIKELSDASVKCGWFYWSPHCPLGECAPFHFMGC